MSEMTRNTKKAIRAMAMVGIVLALFSAVAVADVRLDVPVYDQQDKDWSGDQLGSCKNTTIGSAGCAITSIAMVFKYYGVDTDPQDMNNWSKEKGYYSGGCNIQWKNADKRTNGIVNWAGKPPANLDLIKSELDNRYPVIAKVKVEGYGHYVVVTGYSEVKNGSKIETTLYINDPLGGLEETIPSTSNTRYPGNPEKEVKKIRLYHGPVIQIIDQSISPTTTKPGDELTFVYNISNPYSDKVPEIRLGAQVRTNSPQGEWTDDMSNDRVIDLASGANDYSRLFKLPLDSKPGFYDARWVIINESTKKPINSKEMIRIFEVQKKAPPQPMLDLIILVDTTGSMWDDIENVKESASDIVNTLDASGLDYRVAVADYRDYPVYPYGKPMLDYTYNLDLPFTAKDDQQDIIDAINGLTLGYGCDWRESVYSALVMSMTDVNKDSDNSGNYGWREGASKAIIIMADAPPHDPEPWMGGYTLDDVIYWSWNIDPVMVYSVVIGSDPTTYAAFSEISEETGGKVYSAPDASSVADAIIEAIEDIEVDHGVEVNITPTQNKASPKEAVLYSVNITNKGDITDVYDVSFEADNILGFCRGYPLAIQCSWINFNNSTMELDPSISEIRPLVITVPENWAGMGDVTYIFSVSAESQTDETIGNTSSAELKVRADKRSMIEYSRLEIQWLAELVDSSTIDHGIKNALLATLANAESKADQAVVNLDNGKVADNMLQASQNMVNSFINLVDAQYDKKVSQPDAETLKEKAVQITEDIEKAKAES